MKLVYSQQYEPLLIREAGFVVTMYEWSTGSQVNQIYLNICLMYPNNSNKSNHIQLKELINKKPQIIIISTDRARYGSTGQIFFLFFWIIYVEYHIQSPSSSRFVGLLEVSVQLRVAPWVLEWTVCRTSAGQLSCKLNKWFVKLPLIRLYKILN